MSNDATIFEGPTGKRTSAIVTRDGLTYSSVKTDFGHTFTSTFTMNNGVPRWTTNGSVPPAESIVEYAIDKVPGYDKAATDAARDVQYDAVARNYRAARAEHGYGAEELFEMRAAFGAGAVVVDAITGQSIRL